MIPYWAKIEDQQGFSVLFRFNDEHYYFSAPRYFDQHGPTTHDVNPRKETSPSVISDFKRLKRCSIPQAITWQNENALKDIALFILEQYQTIKA